MPDDADYMARCLELAERYRGRTAPNPIVGCVIVDASGEVIAEGAHAAPGKPHAEIDALDRLGHKAPGATLYVNLEPCAHHGRTPPCAPVVRDAGLARIVVGMEDPLIDHGGGIEVLRAAGIAVEVGVLRERCERANLPFVRWACEGRPAFPLTAAMTLAGKIATVEGQSQWITGASARADVHRLRDTHDAVLVGIGTVLDDDPQLTARGPGMRDPVRIILDRQLRTPPTAKVLPAIIACAGDAPRENEAALVARGAQVVRIDDLGSFARELGRRGLTSVLVEGGGEVHSAMLGSGLADELVLYIAPKLVGGAAKTWVGGKGVAALDDAYGVILDHEIMIFEGDLRLTGRFTKPATSR